MASAPASAIIRAWSIQPPGVAPLRLAIDRDLEEVLRVPHELQVAVRASVVAVEHRRVAVGGLRVGVRVDMPR
jgi:hypothetical protein